MSEILIIGAGDHAKVVAEILSSSGKEIHGFIDILDKKENVGKKILGYPVVDTLSEIYKYSNKACIIAYGDVVKRKEIFSFISGLEFDLVNAIHPSAVISKTLQMGKGNSISAGVVVTVDVEIGDCNIINTGATIDHDVKLGSFININPGVHIAGRVRIGDLSVIGIGASIKDEVSIGKRVTVGAGAVVINDLPDNCVAVGVPAKIIKFKEEQ
jgi:sugar O-acyltransferase (sialic acid O-acetyltransferase NeuD family)